MNLVSSQKDIMGGGDDNKSQNREEIESEDSEHTIQDPSSTTEETANDNAVTDLTERKDKAPPHNNTEITSENIGDQTQVKLPNVRSEEAGEGGSSTANQAVVPENASQIQQHETGDIAGEQTTSEQQHETGAIAGEQTTSEQQQHQNNITANSQVTNENASQVTNENASQVTNENASQVTNENASQVTNENVSQATSGNASQFTNENTSQLDERAMFEQNFAFEQSIKEETKRMPLVCVDENIRKLFDEYQYGSEVYKNKIKKLAVRHGRIRRCRGDGNCFYRAFSFAWFERLLVSNQPTLQQNALKSLADTIQILDQAGYDKLGYENFYEDVLNEMQKIAAGTHDHDTLLSVFQTDDISNSIVCYLRLVTAAYLKIHKDEFEPFLEMDIGMESYCNRFVEVMDQEADHLHVIVLTRALKVPVEIAYMSGSNALEEVNFHEFYPDATGQQHVTVPSKPLVLLYRPGHYDILYRNHGNRQ
ncbi:532_t:CDS:2 [Ambispora gerdemannii]|uniref:ubiquitinyl hydrolase 1 n=1 Tax=Ambispora gerdemannii TaxID=144530 RepID=A0A9N8UVH8_9GLOM|nr:532_t:CDS:2 [Ambispora gerdemannii]